MLRNSPNVLRNSLRKYHNDFVKSIFNNKNQILLSKINYEFSNRSVIQTSIQSTIHSSVYSTIHSNRLFHTTNIIRNQDKLDQKIIEKIETFPIENIELDNNKKIKENTIENSIEHSKESLKGDSQVNSFKNAFENALEKEILSEIKNPKKLKYEEVITQTLVVDDDTTSKKLTVIQSFTSTVVDTKQNDSIKTSEEIISKTISTETVNKVTNEVDRWKQIERRRLEQEFPIEKKLYFEKIIKSTQNLLSRTGSPARKLYNFYQRSILQKHGGSAKLVSHLVDKLKLDGNEHRLDYERELARITEKAVTTENNEIILFHRGDLLFNDLWKRMDEAKECILMETYTLGPDYTGEKTMKKLIEARKRGVEVVLIVDAFGSYSLKSQHFDLLSREGVIIRKFNPISFQSFSFKHFLTRNHRKQCIIDWEYSYVGGMNVEDKYSHLGDLSKLFRDTHCRIRGPFVKQVIVSFLESFEYALHGIDFHRSKEIAQNENLRILQYLRSGLMLDSEHFEESENHYVQLSDYKSKLSITNLPNNLYGGIGIDICFASSHPRAGRRILQACLVNYLDAAQESICICTPYFFPSRPVKRALYRAASRGVKITILTCKKSDVPLMKFAANHLYQNLVMKHGITIYEYEKNILHAKYFVIDSCITSVGSYNFDEVSYFSNLELFLAIYSREIGEHTMKQYEEDKLNSHKITHKWIQDQPTFFFYLQAFAATILRILSKFFKK